jgi:cycloeucalenol cycloisomerase
MSAGGLADHPARRWNERFVLVYSAVWIAVVAAVVLTRAVAHFGEIGYLALGVGLALPLWAVPLVWGPAEEKGRPIAERYSVKAMVFIALMSFIQCYFGSILFFEGLGMKYGFPVRLVLNGTPVFLYFMTVAYFSTYYVALQWAARALRRLAPRAGLLPSLLALAALSYAVAFGETFFMASDTLRDWFSYGDKSFVLRWGSLCYGTVFFLSAPLFFRIDERPERPSALARVTWEALGANMLILIVYELYRPLLRH